MSSFNLNLDWLLSKGLLLRMNSRMLSKVSFSKNLEQMLNKTADNNYLLAVSFFCGN